MAALGAWRTLKMGDRAAAIIFGDEETAYVPALRSRATVHRICSELVRMNHKLDVGSEADDPGALNHALLQAAGLAKHDWLVTLVTDCHGADPETQKLVTRIAQHNDMLAALVYDQLGIQLPAVEGLEVTDGRTRTRLPPEAGFRRRYEEAFVARSRLIRDRFSALEIPVLPICTHDPVVDQVLSALGHRP